MVRKNCEDQHNENHEHDLDKSHNVECSKKTKEENVEFKEQESQTPTEMKHPEQNSESRDTVEPLQEMTGSKMETTDQSQPETDYKRVSGQSVTAMLLILETKQCAQIIQQKAQHITSKNLEIGQRLKY